MISVQFTMPASSQEAPLCRSLQDTAATRALSPRKLLEHLFQKWCLDTMEASPSKQCYQRMIDLGRQFLAIQEISLTLAPELPAIEEKIGNFVKNNAFCEKQPCYGTSYGANNFSKIAIENRIVSQSTGMVTHGPYDVWINQLAAKDAEVGERGSANIIIVEARDRQTNSVLAMPRPYYFKYQPLVAPSYRIKPVQVQSCLKCHSNGTSLIDPIPGLTLTQDMKKIEELNRILAAYNKPDLSYLRNVQVLGPSFNAKQCLSCHGSVMHPLTVMQTLADKSVGNRFGLLTELWFRMPPGSKQTKNVRDALQKTQLLTDEQRLSLRKRVLAASNVYALKKDLSIPFSRKVQSMILDALVSAKHLSKDQKLIAEKEIQVFDDAHRGVAQRLGDEHLETVADWLKEPLLKCD